MISECIVKIEIDIRTRVFIWRWNKIDNVYQNEYDYNQYILLNDRNNNNMYHEVRNILSKKTWKHVVLKNNSKN